MSRLFIVATYWNESDWIESSLRQIKTLKADGVLLIDGCFDPRVENRSTDGTRSIIDEFVENGPEVTRVNATRVSRLRALWELFMRSTSVWNLPLRILLCVYYFRTNQYRLNQAVTFTKAIKRLGVRPGDWVLHIDADQFYADNMIDDINEIVTSDSKFDLLTANEKTFFDDFSHFTTEYEKRNYNNLPYRWRTHTMIVPTRDVVTEQYPKPVPYGKDERLVRKHLGDYFHFKFKPFTPERFTAGNQLGDRVPLDGSKYQTKVYTDTLPNAVQPIIQRIESRIRTKDTKTNPGSNE